MYIWENKSPQKRIICFFFIAQQTQIQRPGEEAGELSWRDQETQPYLLFDFGFQSSYGVAAETVLSSSQNDGLSFLRPLVHAFSHFFCSLFQT